MRNTDTTGKTFMNIVAGDFSKIKSKFINKCKTNEIEFDEDLFMDAFLCCCKTLNDKEMSKEECIKYYWVSYINKIKTDKPKELKFVSFDEIESSSSVMPQFGSYCSWIDDKYNGIIEYIYQKYDKEYAEAWILHICEGKSYKELSELGYDFKFNDIFKRIMKNVRKEFKNK